jgi:hypothetical protein
VEQFFAARRAEDADGLAASTEEIADAFADGALVCD